MLALRVVTARVRYVLNLVLLRPLIGDGAAISMWSSMPREGLTICRCQSKSSTFSLVKTDPERLVPPEFKPTTSNLAVRSLLDSQEKRPPVHCSNYR